MRFNIILSLLKLKKYRRALKKCEALLQSTPGKYYKDIARLYEIINTWVRAGKSGYSEP